jgi:hypothetical protein
MLPSPPNAEPHCLFCGKPIYQAWWEPHRTRLFCCSEHAKKEHDAYYKLLRTSPAEVQLEFRREVVAA